MSSKACVASRAFRSCAAARALPRTSITAGARTSSKRARSSSLHMTESLTTELFELLALRRRQVLARGWKETPDWVFCSDVGSSIDPRNFSRVWERFRRRAQAEGIRPLKLHATRHTWASMALESGKNIRWVADQLGHADPALTLRVYSHVLKSEERDHSFAEFGPKRPYTAPTGIEADERVAQPLETIGGPPGPLSPTAICTSDTRSRFVSTSARRRSMAASRTFGSTTPIPRLRTNAMSARFRRTSVGSDSTGGTIYTSRPTTSSAFTNTPSL